VVFLGYHIAEKGAEPLLKHLETILAFQRPQDVKGLQGFLSLIKFYCRFTLAAAHILLPLTSALAYGKKIWLIWSLQMEAAFEACQCGPAQGHLSGAPDPSATTCLAMRCFQLPCGAVLQ
jgi:hypothetical protein